MSKENILYIFMNKNFEFTDEKGNITENIFEAAEYKDFEDDAILTVLQELIEMKY